ncbi:MAG: pyruvate decarboxylase [Microbacterium sp.]|nr:pyruvate decarboxylase [Microbacterium sp.]
MGEYTVADYLLDRLAEVGVRHLFGVPGDFTLRFLDRVIEHPRVDWVGCSNELGAGYAADGYARLAGMGALSTTFGVGELSALNAVAGSYAEHVPVLHIVGAPTTHVQHAARATHHTLGDGDFRHFARMSAEITGAQALLTPDQPTLEIDRVIAEVVARSLPGYLVVPADVADLVVTPPGAPLPTRHGVTDPLVLGRFQDALRRRLDGVSDVAVLADILVQRLGAEPELHKLLAHDLPHATLLWGRRVVDESHAGYLGPYLGAASEPTVREAIEGAEVLVMAGVQFTDLTTGFFSERIDPDRTIEIRGESTSIGAQRFTPLAMKDALDAVEAAIQDVAPPRLERSPDAAATTVAGPMPPTSAEPSRSLDHSADDGLAQDELWTTVSAALEPGDVVIADQGTAFYGMAAHRLPGGVTFIGQPLWAAIGYTLPATLGAGLAAPGRRPILLIGDGAAQLTIAELGTLIRNRVPAIIVLVDNGGYAIERLINGPSASYNDIAPWDWRALVGALGGRDASGVRVGTADELRSALVAARRDDDLVLIQARTGRRDVPPVLEALARAAAGANHPAS